MVEGGRGEGVEVRVKNPCVALERLVQARVSEPLPSRVSVSRPSCLASGEGGISRIISDADSCDAIAFGVKARQ